MAVAMLDFKFVTQFFLTPTVTTKWKSVPQLFFMLSCSQRAHMNVQTEGYFQFSLCPPMGTKTCAQCPD